jgi:hypothetical protein
VSESTSRNASEGARRVGVCCRSGRLWRQGDGWPSKGSGAGRTASRMEMCRSSPSGHSLVPLSPKMLERFFLPPADWRYLRQTSGRGTGTGLSHGVRQRDGGSTVAPPPARALRGGSPNGQGLQVHEKVAFVSGAAVLRPFQHLCHIVISPRPAAPIVVLPPRRRPAARAPQCPAPDIPRVTPSRC